MDLDDAHRRKIAYYQGLAEQIREQHAVTEVTFSSITLSCRGIWSPKSAKQLVDLNILQKKELQIISTRVLIGGLNEFWMFGRMTSRRIPSDVRRGVG